MSDGSLKNTCGTSGFTSMMEKEELDYTGANHVPGEDNDQTSYRSKLIGILTNVVMHNAICKVHDIKDPHEVKIGCDNESALWTGFGDDDIKPWAASSDILHVLHHQLKISPLKWITTWVKGHQDKQTK